MVLGKVLADKRFHLAKLFIVAIAIFSQGFGKFGSFCWWLSSLSRHKVIFSASVLVSKALAFSISAVLISAKSALPKILQRVKSNQYGGGSSFQSASLAQVAPAQHSVHPTGGSLRVFWHFAWLRVGSVKAALSHPAHQPVTQAVGQVLALNLLSGF